MFLNSILTLYILGSRLASECESTMYIWVISASNSFHGLYWSQQNVSDLYQRLSVFAL